jgi:hypothetical protein
MSTYYVDFSGWCEAEAKFWEYIYDNAPLPHNNYTLEGVEETTD